MVKDGSYLTNRPTQHMREAGSCLFTKAFCYLAALFHLHLIGFYYMSAKYQEYQH